VFYPSDDFIASHAFFETRKYIGGCFGLSRNILLFYIEKQGMAMRFEVGGGSAAALLRNQHHLFPFVILHFRRVCLFIDYGKERGGSKKLNGLSGACALSTRIH
jgi:hypothetical protein